MREDFETALTFVLKEEGGYVDNPDDHGLATNAGITTAVYCEFKNDPTANVQNITPDEVNTIYLNQFWIPAYCDLLPIPLDICHMDWAVQHSPQWACIGLQVVLGVAQDGVIGPGTLAAIAAQPLSTLISNYLQYRRNWYNAEIIRVPTDAEFLPDWLGRVDRLQTYVAGMLS